MAVWIVAGRMAIINIGRNMAEIFYLAEVFRRFCENTGYENNWKEFKKLYLEPNKENLAPLMKLNFLWEAGIKSLFKKTDLNSYKDMFKRLDQWGYPERIFNTLEKAESVLGRKIPAQINLFFTLRGIVDGVTVYHKGVPYIYIGLDYPAEKKEYFDLVTAHELAHAARDTSPGVMEAYNGRIKMNHIKLLSITPFIEHTIGEGIATAFSECLFPNLPPWEYLFYGKPAYRWCEEHFEEIYKKIDKIKNDRGNLFRFYRKSSLMKGSPGREDYYLGYKSAKKALQKHSIKEVIRMRAEKVYAFLNV